MVDGNDIGGLIGAGLMAGVGIATLGAVERMSENVEPRNKRRKKNEVSEGKTQDQELFDLLF